jgi:hypothetical protein
MCHSTQLHVIFKKNHRIKGKSQNLRTQNLKLVIKVNELLGVINKSRNETPPPQNGECSFFVVFFSPFFSQGSGVGTQGLVYSGKVLYC